MRTDIAVEPLFIKKLPKPYSNCLEANSIEVSGSEYLRIIKQSNLTYSRIVCFGLIRNDYLTNNCGCVGGFDMDFNGVYKRCISRSELDCIHVYKSMYDDTNVLNLFSHKCPPECEKSKYLLSSKYLTFPSHSYRQILRKNPKIIEKFSNISQISDDQFDSSIVAVNVYLNDLAYIEITEQASQSLIILFSNVGGLLGVFLGFSILSFFELIDLLIEVFIYLVYDKF
jgi:hypothetical protein